MNRIFWDYGNIVQLLFYFDVLRVITVDPIQWPTADGSILHLSLEEIWSVLGDLI